MRAADILVKEHDAIMIVVDAAKAEAGRITATGNVNGKLIREMVEFFRNFVDKCHHGKEEKHYFPLLEARGIPRVMGPIGCMLSEHDMGRGETGAIVRALDAFEKGRAKATTELAQHLQAYAELLTAHIHKENEILFKLGDTVLTPKDQSDLIDSFETAEREEMEEGEHDRYRAWAQKLLK